MPALLCGQVVPRTNALRSVTNKVAIGSNGHAPVRYIRVSLNSSKVDAANRVAYGFPFNSIVSSQAVLYESIYVWKH
eukprot:scaffold144413_cov18-Prasinocladus_malaysianus.AAC.1